jgi:hypothetical protein
MEGRRALAFGRFDGAWVSNFFILYFYVETLGVVLLLSLKPNI